MFDAVPYHICMYNIKELLHIQVTNKYDYAYFHNNHFPENNLGENGNNITEINYFNIITLYMILRQFAVANCLSVM